MNLLEPRWNQQKPTLQEAQEMCGRVAVTAIESRSDAIETVLQHLRKSHSNGGALFGEFEVGDSEVFDWFASRNRLAEFSILRTLLVRDEVQRRIPELRTSATEKIGRAHV